MDQYVDFTIRDIPEIPTSFILNKLFAKLHLALCADASGSVGVSFPMALKTFGGVLRLHGSQSSLQKLQSQNWYESLSDYVVITDLLAVPESCDHQTLRRVQVKSNITRLMRRSVKKGWISEEEANERINNQGNAFSKLPYLHLNSVSTGQSFKLFIEISSPVAEPVTGEFNSYGLSQTATVPFF